MLLEEAAALVAAGPPLVVFTGAGVSTESGIPDFRSATGLWARHDPADFSYPTFMASREGRRRYWAVGRELYGHIQAARPNAAHLAIAELDRLGLLDCVITQNVDNLHQRAGVAADRVLELHGNATRVRCLECESVVTRDQVQLRLQAGEEVPDCLGCGGILKPFTVLFGEAMPQEALAEAQARAGVARTCLVVGSSLTVFPAAYIPLRAREAGARLVIVNLTETRLDREAAVVLRGPAAGLLAALVAEVRGRREGAPA